MKNKKILIIMSMFALLLIPLGIAQEETGGTYSKQGAIYMDNGIIINHLVHYEINKDDTLTLYMTPYEQSGKTLDATDVNCRYGITSPNGDRLLLMTDDLNNFTHISEDDIWVGVVPKSFFNETGEYLYNWDCQNVLRGGYFNGVLKVVDNGDKNFKLNLNDNVDMMILIIVLVISTVLLIFNNTRFFGGIGYAVAGLMLMFSGVNFVVSTLLLVLGLFMSALNNQ